jgi:hypothetical protein
LPQGRTKVVVTTAPRRWARTSYPRLTYSAPPLVIDDAARAAVILAHIRERCPTLTRADFLLVAKVLSERAKDVPPARKPSKKRRRL